jgi:Polyglycine hydrolase-like, structural repeat
MSHTSLRYAFLGGLVLLATAPAEAQRGEARVAPPSARIVRQSAPTSCGDWGAVTWEACGAVASCNAQRVDGADVGPLSDAIKTAVERHLERTCDGLSCGQARTREDNNSFACRGRTQLCLTRTLEFACGRSSRSADVPQRTAPPQREQPPQRVPPPPRPLPDPPPARRVPSPAPAPPPAAPPPPTSPALAGAIYQLPLFANDMAPGERYYTHDHAVTDTQLYGYDISMQRYKDDASWTSLLDGVTDHWKDPKNESYVIYRKPFYAMRDGTIMGCWRNAPENPRPKLPDEDSDTIPFADRKWLHQKFRDGLIPGGGNMLWIKHDDGTYALYAHAVPGTIPATFCPNAKTIMDAPTPDNATLLDGVVSPATLLPEAQRTRVKAGDFLGRIGNSGNSTNPHIHIHVQRSDRSGNWAGTPTRFARGLATPWDEGKAGVEGWGSFSGQVIPKGDVLFWPPTRLGKEYARHGFSADDLQRMFSHLANSGFMPEVLDCSSVGGEVFYNMVWRPAEGPWRAHFGMTGDTIEKKFDDEKADGFHPVYVDSCTSKNGLRYVAIFRQGGGLYRWRYGIGEDDHQQVFDKAKADGLWPVNVSVVSVNGNRRYTSLFRKVDYGTVVLRSKLDEREYQKEIDENKAAGRKPVYLAVYMHDGEPNFSAIFTQKPAGAWMARHGLTASGYQTEYTSAVDDGYLTHALAGYDGAKENSRYAAVWWK